MNNATNRIEAMAKAFSGAQAAALISARCWNAGDFCRAYHWGKARDRRHRVGFQRHLAGKVF